MNEIFENQYSAASMCMKLYAYAVAVRDLPFIDNKTKLDQVTKLIINTLTKARKESLKVDKKASISEKKLVYYIEKFNAQKSLDDTITFLSNIIKKAQDADAKKGN